MIETKLTDPILELAGDTLASFREYKGSEQLTRDLHALENARSSYLSALSSGLETAERQRALIQARAKVSWTDYKLTA